MTTALARAETWEIMEKVVMEGDLSALSPQERVEYYRATCESLGLNPLTKPFQYIKLNGKLTLYATKDATDQIRKHQGVSIVDMGAERIDDLYRVQVKAQDKGGRTEVASGVVSVQGMRGENLANAMMKAETKAKRRVTLSLCGLGVLDESEIDGIPRQVVQTWDEQFEAEGPVLESGTVDLGEDEPESSGDWPKITNPTQFWHHAKQLGFKDADAVLEATGVDVRDRNQDINWLDLYIALVD